MKPLHIARAQPDIYFNPVLPERIKDCLACESTSTVYKKQAGKQRRRSKDSIVKQRQALLKLMRCAYQAGKKSKINDIYYFIIDRWQDELL